MKLPPELCIQIVEEFRYDKSNLRNLSIVDPVFRDAVQSILFEKITLGYGVDKVKDKVNGILSKEADGRLAKFIKKLNLYSTAIMTKKEVENVEGMTHGESKGWSGPTKAYLKAVEGRGKVFLDCLVRLFTAIKDASGTKLKISIDMGERVGKWDYFHIEPYIFTVCVESLAFAFGMVDLRGRLHEFRFSRVDSSNINWINGPSAFVLKKQTFAPEFAANVFKQNISSIENFGVYHMFGNDGKYTTPEDHKSTDFCNRACSNIVAATRVKSLSLDIFTFEFPSRLDGLKGCASLVKLDISDMFIEGDFGRTLQTCKNLSEVELSRITLAWKSSYFPKVKSQSWEKVFTSFLSLNLTCLRIDELGYGEMLDNWYCCGRKDETLKSHRDQDLPAMKIMVVHLLEEGCKISIGGGHFWRKARVVKSFEDIPVCVHEPGKECPQSKSRG